MVCLGSEFEGAFSSSRYNLVPVEEAVISIEELDREQDADPEFGMGWLGMFSV